MDSPATTSWRARMRSDTGKLLFKLRGPAIEWVNAGARRRGLYGFCVRGQTKVRAVALWRALADNIACLIHNPRLQRSDEAEPRPARGNTMNGAQPL